VIINNRIIPGISGSSPVTSGNKVRSTVSTGVSFEDMLKDQIYKNSEIKFSKHAESRLESRNIQITDERKEKLNEAINKANEKNVKDSLVMLDDLAFVVNVKNKTVVTVLNKDEMKDNVFTNIDGAVIA
jgi:flagellar operon protein